MDNPKRQFGGRQDGSGRPALPEDEKLIKAPAVHLKSATLGQLIDRVGNERGAVSREIRRIVEQYFAETKIV